MSDEPLAPEPARGPETRTHYLIGGLAFVGGIAVTAAAFQLGGGGGTPRPVPSLVPVETVQTEPNRPAALPAGTDVATLGAREQELAGKLDQLELRLRDISGSARNASSYASRAEQLLIAAGVRRAIERGQPLGALDGQLRLRFGESHGEAVSMILRASADPVTLGDLRLALETIAPRLASGADDSMWMSVRRLLSDLVVLREADSPSPRTSDRMRRARLALDHELPEDRAELVAELDESLRHEAPDRFAALGEDFPIGAKARRLDREDEAVGRGLRPAFEGRGLEGGIIGAVDLDRAQRAAGEFELLFLAQALRIEGPAPRLEGPAADADSDGCLCHEGRRAPQQRADRRNPVVPRDGGRRAGAAHL